MGLQLGKIESQKPHQFFRGLHPYVLCSELIHLAIVALLAARVHVTSTTESPNVTVKLGTDVIQLVKDGDHFFFKGQIEESRQEEREDIQRLAALM